MMLSGKPRLSSFIQLNNTNLKNYVGLEMKEGTSYIYGHDYSYIDIPGDGFRLVSSDTPALVPTASHNQFVFLVAAAKLTLRPGIKKILVEASKELSHYGIVSSGLYYVHSYEAGEKQGGHVPYFTILLRRDIHIDNVPFPFRLYLRQ